jgi:hypothetical protein
LVIGLCFGSVVPEYLNVLAVFDLIWQDVSAVRFEEVAAVGASSGFFLPAVVKMTLC